MIGRSLGSCCKGVAGSGVGRIRSQICGGREFFYFKEREILRRGVMNIHSFSVWWFGASAPVISFCFCMS